jgi:serine/threonine protein kinase/tetratricopeptide (TPR) repeat protein
VVSVEDLVAILAQHQRYRVQRRLGRGGMGEVFQVHDSARQLDLALKVLQLVHPAWLARFKQEFRIVADLHHPHIARLYDLESHGSLWYFTMELVDGVDFLRHVRRDHHAEAASTPAAITATWSRPGLLAAATPATLDAPAHGPISRTAETVPLTPAAGSAELPLLPAEPAAPFADTVDETALRAALLQLAQALQALHEQGIVHRDLKPSNILVTPAGRLVLLDFGIASAASDAGPAARAGTPAFVAPEQARGEPPRPPADWYAFGGVLYAALTGQLPYPGDTELVLSAKLAGAPPAPLSHRVRDVPADLETLCLALLASRPEQRPTGAEILARLQRSPAPRRPRSSLPPGNEVFVGRSAERAFLADAYRRSHTAPVCTLIRGASGLGKSTLLRHFTAEEAATALCLWGRCHERENVPFKGLDAIVDGLAATLSELSPDTRDALLPADAPLIARLFPTFATALPRPAPPPPERGPVESRLDGFLALATLLDRLARHRPLVLVLDDLQWADGDTLELLRLLLGPRAPRLLFVLLLRDDDPGPTADWLAALRSASGHLELRETTLAPLDDTESRTLVTTLGGSPDAAVASAQGNPLLLAELARHTPPATGAPLDFATALGARIAELPAPARQLLGMLAVAGEALPLSLLASAAAPLAARTDAPDTPDPADQLTAETRQQAFFELHAGRLLRVTRPGADPWIDIFHDQIRAIELDRTDPARRSLAHRSLAEELLAWPQAHTATVARHLLAAGNPAAAADHFARAAAAARANLAFLRAAAFYDAALQHGQHDRARHIELLTARAEALSCAGSGQQAADLYRQAADLLATDPTDPTASAAATDDSRADLLARAGAELLRSGRYDEGVELVRTLLRNQNIPLPHHPLALKLAIARNLGHIALRRRARRPPPPTTATQRRRHRLMRSSCEVLLATDFLAGSALVTRFLRDVLPTADDEMRAYAEGLQALAWAARDPDDPRIPAALGRLLTLAARVDQPHLHAFRQLSEGLCWFFASALHRAETHLADAATAFAALPDGRFEWLKATQYRNVCLWYLGELRLLDAEVQRLQRLADSSEDQVLRAVASVQALYHHLPADRPDDAQRQLAHALAIAPAQISARHWEYTLNTLVTHNYRHDGRAALQSAARWEAPLRRALMVHLPPARAMYWSQLGLAALHAGDWPTVHRVTRAMHPLHHRWGRGTRAYLRAALAARAGDLTTTLDQLGTALAAERAIARPIAALPFQYRLGQLLGGDTGRALTLEARTWAETQAIRDPDRFLTAYAPPLPTQ